MNDHFFAPCIATSSRTLSSSSLRQGPLTRSGLRTCAGALVSAQAAARRGVSRAPSASDAGTGHPSYWKGSPRSSSSCGRHASSPCRAAAHPVKRQRDWASVSGGSEETAAEQSAWQGEPVIHSPPQASSTTPSSPPAAAAASPAAALRDPTDGAVHGRRRAAQRSRRLRLRHPQH